MKGTFRIGDILHISEVPFQSILIGDVIVFKNIEKEIDKSFIVHRVVRKINGQIITRGDNNTKSDTLPVTKSNLIGEVSIFERNGGTFKVRSGIRGFVISRIKYFIRRVLVIFYQLLYRSELIRKIMVIFLKLIFRHITKIKLISDKDKIYKWVYRQNVIARQGPGKGDFYCQKPFNLIIKKQKIAVP